MHRHIPFGNAACRAVKRGRHVRLVDCIAQCRTPYIVQNLTTNALTRLNGAADFASEMARCPMRFVLSDELTRLCTALAYSKGARQLACADLLRIPAESIWIEWCDAAWLMELQRYGFRMPTDDPRGLGHRGALIRAARDGRSGLIRTFWTVGAANPEVLASSMEAYFDLDTPEGEEPAAPDAQEPTDAQVRGARCVTSSFAGEPDIMRRYFRFRYERSWADYYQGAMLCPESEAAIARHALGTIAADIPMLLAFFLLLSTRNGLPRRLHVLDRLNKARARSGKAPLLDHIEVLSPVLPEHDGARGNDSFGGRRAPRLHHVRGHLMRRGSELYWRVPHLRGNARSGVVRTRTVTWTIDRPISGCPQPAPQLGTSM
jgi:hypothetical protein